MIWYVVISWNTCCVVIFMLNRNSALSWRSAAFSLVCFRTLLLTCICISSRFPVDTGSAPLENFAQPTSFSTCCPSKLCYCVESELASQCLFTFSTYLKLFGVFLTEFTEEWSLNGSWPQRWSAAFKWDSWEEICWNHCYLSWPHSWLLLLSVVDMTQSTRAASFCGGLSSNHHSVLVCCPRRAVCTLCSLILRV